MHSILLYIDNQQATSSLFLYTIQTLLNPQSVATVADLPIIYFYLSLPLSLLTRDKFTKCICFGFKPVPPIEIWLASSFVRSRAFTCQFPNYSCNFITGRLLTDFIAPRFSFHALYTPRTRQLFDRIKWLSTTHIDTSRRTRSDDAISEGGPSLS